MTTRRQFIQLSAAVGGGLLLPPIYFSATEAARAAALPGGTLDPTKIRKFAQPLAIPPAMPKAKPPAGMTVIGDYYSIAVRQFQQQVLPVGMPKTTVWGYGSTTDPTSFHAPSPTIEATVGRQTIVTWSNGLVDGTGNYLPHLLPVDQTLHWANPPGGPSGRDSRPTFTSTPGPYTGPVPMVTHVHGAHVAQESDGYPEAWFLPNARNIPAGYARVGTFYEAYQASSPLGKFWSAGNSVYQYDNDQAATTLWYHDHTLGMTRLNVSAGPAGFYVLRGGPNDLAPGAVPSGKYEIPIVVQDRMFNTDGSLFYPADRAFFNDTPAPYTGPFIPFTDVPPIWNPEVFGNTMVVNGQTWPFLNVEQRRYRFRLLNACQSRFLILKLDNGMPFWQIGGDGGFLRQPIALPQLLLGPAERADVIVDFSSMRVGTRILVQNVGPDEPFGGGVPGVDFQPSDAKTTGQVMQFNVVDRVGTDTTTAPGSLVLPPLPTLGASSKTRQVSLNELVSRLDPTILDGPAEARLGTLSFDASGAPVGNPLMWMERVTETPALGAIETWEIYNFTEDAHPIHIHLVQFQVVERQAADGTVRGPETWESGYKDTLVAYPGEITRFRARFDKRGRYVWHCHILEHEDNEMMRPYVVG